jgi:hypothetical protein
MHRLIKLSVLGLAASVASACDIDTVIETENIPTAGVRFINAVPDTNQMDFRFVDFVENNAHFRIPFRNNPATSGTGVNAVTASLGIQYKNTRAAPGRQYRIFLNDTLQSVASTVVTQGTLDIQEGRLYSVVLWGYARTGATPPMRLDVFEENRVVPAGMVSLRIMNATGSAIDGRYYPHLTGSLPAAATWANVPALTFSSYVDVLPEQVRFNIQPAGGGTALFADALALIGSGAQSAGAPCTAETGYQSLAILATTTTLDPATHADIVRTTGSFTTDGFLPGMVVNLGGFSNPSNNTAATVRAVAALRLTVEKTGGFLTETPGVYRTVTGPSNRVCDLEGHPGTTRPGSAVTAIVWPGSTPRSNAPQTSAFLSTTTTIQLQTSATAFVRPAAQTGSFITDGFTTGMTVIASGFTNPANNGTFTVSGAVTATNLPVTPAPVPEAASGGRLITGAPRPAVTFMWDIRPPRPPGT